MIHLLIVAALAFFASAKLSPAAAQSVFPENEAVRLVDGQRVIELPPLTATAKQRVKAGAAHQRPQGNSEVYMIEAGDGLMECSVPYLVANACTASSVGTVKRPRFWTVKLRGAWVHCTTRDAARKCSPVSLGVPALMSVVE